MATEDGATGTSTDVHAIGSDNQRAPEASPQLRGLDEQIDWYDRKSLQAQVRFKWLKGVEITAAACIPLMTANSVLLPLAGGLGVLVTVVEGLLHLNQYQHNWITYRATCEALRHERYLYIAGAGAYANASRPNALLAERVEALLSRELARWTATSSTSPRRSDRQQA
jgi:hypothetical protein